MSLRILLFWLLSLAFVGAGAAGAPEKVREVEGIVEYRLDNGLQVLLAPDPSKPTTTVNLTFRVGSRHEGYGETGMAHLLEHLMFKGTPTTRNVLAEFSRRGLRANGTTSYDRTNYYASFAADEENLHWYLSWLADAMVNSLIARADLDSEMTVVRNEMEMGENSPMRVLWQKTVAAMFQWHNYGKSTIGARADVENVDIESLRAFYRRYYQPDNATLIVSGSFEPDQVLRRVQESFGAISKPGRELPQQYTLEPPQDGERSVTIRRVGGVPLVIAGYHVPAAAHPDYPAVELIDIVLSDTPSGRLHKRLVERQLAASVFGWAFALADPGLALWGAQLAPGQDVERARAELLAVVEGLDAEPVTKDELERARTKWLNDWEQLYANPERVGVALSESVAQGDWRLFFLLRDRVQAMTLDHVNRVARERLLESNRTVGTYLPTESPARAPAPVDVNVAEQLKEFKPRPSAQAVAAFEASPQNIEAHTERATLPVGMQVALLPKPTRGRMVHATLTLRFGDVRSLTGQTQVAAMAARLLDKGTSKMSRQEIQDRLDALQTELSFSGGHGSVTASLRTRREHAVQALELVAHLLREATFPDDALAEAQRQLLATVQAQRSEPGAVAHNALARHDNPYPRGDPRYARTFDEIIADVKAVAPEQVRAFHRRFYGAGHAQFAAVGDFDVAAVRAALERAFADWRSDAPFERVPQPFVKVDPARLVLLTPDKQNAVLLTQQPLPINDTHADHPALMLANFLLGGSPDSRLWDRIREREGLSYDVRSHIGWNPFEAHSTWEASAIFAPDSLERVERAFREETERALADGFEAAEIAGGKNSLLNYRRLGRAQDGALAAALAGDLYLGRTMEHARRVDEALAALTGEQVNAALRRYLQPGTFVTAVAGDFNRKP